MNMIRARSYNISNFTFIFLWFSIDFPQPPEKHHICQKFGLNQKFGLLIVAGLAEQACFTWAVLAHPPHSLPKSIKSMVDFKMPMSEKLKMKLKSIERSILLFLPFFPTTIHYKHQDILSVFLVHPSVLQLKVNRKPGNPCPNSVKARGFTSHVAAVAASGKTVGGLVQQLPQSLGEAWEWKLTNPTKGPKPHQNPQKVTNTKFNVRLQ